MITMMHVGKETLIGDIQHEFNMLFPYLRIEFAKSDGKNASDKKPEKLSPRLKFSAIASIPKEMDLDLDENQKVAHVKKVFGGMGILALIYRQSGKVWIETSLTEDWSLKRQNDEGALFSPLYE
ncbi:MAG: hypothetical protein R2794_01945 [Chitinophagales bacterium]